MKNYKRYLVSILLFISIAIYLPGCSKSGKEFDSFVNEIFKTEVQRDSLTLNFSLAEPENYGITNPNVSFGHYSVDYINDMLVSSENYLAALKKFDYNSLTEEQKLTYDILKADLELELELGDYILYTESLGPTTGIQAQLPVLLAEYNFYEKDDIDTYIKLLPRVYDYFKEIVKFEKEKSAAGLFMSDGVAESIIEQCKTFISNKNNNYLIVYFNEKIENFNGLTKDEIKTYQKANKDAVINYIIPAYEYLVSSLESLKGTGNNEGGLCNFENGKEFYEFLIRLNTGSNRPVPELIDMLDSTINNNLNKLSAMLSKNPQLYEEANPIKFSLTDPVEIVDYLKKAINRDFPTSPDVDCTIKYVHESLRDHLSPAMYLIPPIDSFKSNVIYINNNPEYNMDEIFTTLAHEGYPGHLYQSVYFRHKDTAPIRNLLNFGGYVEGWATYVEYYSYHLAGFHEEFAEFMETNMAVNMALYCRLDMGIHYEGWSLSDTALYLKRFGIEDQNNVRLLYSTLIEEPALYPQYGIGYLEIMELKNTAKDELGDNFVIKDFHTFLLDLGPAQFDVINKYFEEWLTKISKN